MREIPTFDNNFIAEWEHNYYSCGQEDEDDYQRLIREAKKDCVAEETISKETLKGILKWKDTRERVTYWVEWERYEAIYAPRLLLIVSRKIPDDWMIRTLIWDAHRLMKTVPVEDSTLKKIEGKAKGFQVVVASTILHFIFPDDFPIIDVRTAETMYLADRIRSPNKSDDRVYAQFRAAILEIARKTDCSLHAIDRALFACHRDRLQPKMDETFRALRISYTQGVGPDLGLTLDAPWRLRQMVIDKMKSDC